MRKIKTSGKSKTNQEILADKALMFKKEAKKNIAKAKGKRKRKMIKDPTLAAKKALAKLSPEQIALIAAQFKTLEG